MTSLSKDQRRRRGRHLPYLCAAVLLSPSETSAFAPLTPATTKSTLASVSATVQKYRVEDEESPIVSQPKHQSDAYSFLPSRLSTIKRLDEPSQFRAQLLEDKDSLLVVRFYAEVCPSCRATRPLFTKWSRDLETGMQKSQHDALPIKILEMPLNKATSVFIRDTLQVDRLPYCHLYHPEFGMVEEQLVLNKKDFQEFVYGVDCWSKGGCEVELESLHSTFNQGEESVEFESQDDEDCVEFC